MPFMGPTHYTKTDLKDRGWSAKLIAELLGDPDETTTNPHHRSGPPISWYAKRRVHQAERRVAFRRAQVGREERQESAHRAVETKEERLLDAIDALEIEVRMLGWEELTARAISHFNGRITERMYERRGNFDATFAGTDSDPEFLDRIRVNYLRHQASCYERVLHQIKGKVGKAEGYLALKAKVLLAIAEAYPTLADECERQRETAEDVAKLEAWEKAAR